MTWNKSQQKYARSSKGREARRRYQQSEKGKATRKAYLARRKARLIESKLKQAEEVKPVQKNEKSVKIKSIPTGKNP